MRGRLSQQHQDPQGRAREDPPLGRLCPRLHLGLRRDLTSSLEALSAHLKTKSVSEPSGVRGSTECETQGLFRRNCLQEESRSSGLPPPPGSLFCDLL